MPPIRKKKDDDAKQKSVKEMLIAKAGQTSHSRTTKLKSLPTLFSTYVDITKPVDQSTGNYNLDFSCTKTARVYFRENSNLNDVLREYMKTITVQNKPLSAYTSAMIRAVLTPLRQCEHPFEHFRFNSPAHEALGKTLLIFPNICSQEHLDEFFGFQERLGLKLCSVAMYKDNKTREDGIGFVRDTQRRLKKNGLVPFYKRCFKFHVERLYYERVGAVTNCYLQDLTVSDLERISNFQKVVQKMMLEDDKPEHLYKLYAKTTLKGFKKNPVLIEVLSYSLVVNANYNLITNVMTNEQQEEVANDIVKFHTKTTAGQIFKRFRRTVKWPDFHAQYKDRNNFDRKLPPFHNLRYFGDAATTAAEPVSGPLQFVTFRRFQREPKSPSVVKNPPAVADISPVVEAIPEAHPSTPAAIETPHELNSVTSEESSKQTVMSPPASFFGSAEDDELIQFTVPQRLLKEPELSDDIAPLIQLLAPDKMFVAHIKEDLSVAYKSNFADTWKKNKNRIIFNLLDHCWRKDMRKLRSYVSHCSPAVIQPALNVIEAKQIGKIDDVALS